MQMNDIDLSRWREYTELNTNSLWIIGRRDSSGAHTSTYWGNFVPQIPRQLLQRYTRQGEWVLDAFAGSGTTLIEGQRLGRHTLGIELQESVAADAIARVQSEPNPYGVTSRVVVGDSATVDFPSLLAAAPTGHAQFALLHPPYHNIIRFSDDPRDPSTADDLFKFITMFDAIVANVATALAPGRMLALVAGDKYAAGEWTPLGFLLMQAVQRHGFLLKSIVVKDVENTTAKRGQDNLWRYRALAGGFFVFKHEYIFLLQKQ